MNDCKRKSFFGGMVRHLLLSWLTGATVEYMLLSPELRDLSGLDGLRQASFLRVALITICLTCVLALLSLKRRVNVFERWATVCVFAFLAIASLCANIKKNFTFCLFELVLMAIMLVYGKYGHNGSPELRDTEGSSRKFFLWLTVVFAALFFFFICLWSVNKFNLFKTPTYDFGIFSQMFYNMKTTGLPMTTLERDKLLSHFHVHVSPIWYALLPFYCLVPKPETLQVLQAAVIASSVIPLWKIGKLHRLKDWQKYLLCATLMALPAFSGGAAYDIHENCFLAPLLLWLFYGVDKGNVGIIAVSAFLTLMVKEDAAVYVAVIALYLLARSLLRQRKKDLLIGVGMLSAALIWFMLATAFLTKVGEGVMTNRYKNFIYDGSSSLFTVVKAVFLSPMKAVYECADKEKISFICHSFLPLLGLPLATRRYERYFLLIPYILINLASDYPYQHNFFFQYSFGSVVCLIYLATINLADLKQSWIRTAALNVTAAVCSICFFTSIFPYAAKYTIDYAENPAYYRNIRETLETIPDDSSVASSTFYTAFLSRRKILYDVDYCSKEHLLDCQYVVLSKNQKDREQIETELKEKGYEAFKRVDKTLTIYKQSDG